MKKQKYDTMIVGPISLDIMIDCHGREERLVGGASVQSGYAAANCGARTAIFTKAGPEVDIYRAFENCPADVYWRPSKASTSICNRYFTEDKERRECTLLSRADGISFEELPPVETEIYHFAGLTVGDFDESVFEKAAAHGRVAVDVQCLLRRGGDDGSMTFHDWADKERYLPFIDFLKTDAAEAEILTGQQDRREAARMLHAWGAKEILITHNTEVLVYDGSEFHTCPIRARSFAGRTGRGDTTFAGYLTERLEKDIPEALLFATALVSLKMETPGPFCGTRQDVEQYIADFYLQ